MYGNGAAGDTGGKVRAVDTGRGRSGVFHGGVLGGVRCGNGGVGGDHGGAGVGDMVRGEGEGPDPQPRRDGGGLGNGGGLGQNPAVSNGGCAVSNGKGRRS